MERQLLYQCILRNDSEGALKIIGSGVLAGSLNTEVEFVTPLYLAALKNNAEVVLKLLENGADPNLRNSSSGSRYAGETPVHAAARNRSAAALKLLLARNGNALAEQHVYGIGTSSKETPFDLSVRYIEPPGPVTDMLIEAGAKPQAKTLGFRWDQLGYVAGTHWAMASYAERHGDISMAIDEYAIASKFYELAAKKVLGSERWWKFANSPVMRSIALAGTVATGAAAQSQGTVVIWGDPSPSSTLLAPNNIQTTKTYANNLHDAGERYAAYSKLCLEKSNGLKTTHDGNNSSKQ